jgi:DNA-binding response OmpR family regulator
MMERRLLFTSADWQTRAMTLALLQEQGYEVMALPALRLGIKALLQDRVEPPLALVDTKDDEGATPEQLHYLRELLPETPIILLTGAFEQAVFAPLRDTIDLVLVRPISVGEIVEAVQRLAPNPMG